MLVNTNTGNPGRPWASPATHRNEFPVGYSLTGCSPAVKYQTRGSGQTGKEQTANQRASGTLRAS